ncbi:hypothetical protein SLEP1_g55601 [Rubroshorea leprosula]|uniref:Uncharacterized protein n=1 Tax=Rubroshorea leprosula TaxID=152421 RepID=A0AAV5MI16_9ROSI|nr:hypothetical protein SLEP1_g55601 [Rubroshorea leprosula]
MEIYIDVTWQKQRGHIDARGVVLHIGGEAAQPPSLLAIRICCSPAAEEDIEWHKSALRIENARPKSVCRRATLPPSLLGRS